VLRARHLLHPPTGQGKLTVYTSAPVDSVRNIVWRLAGDEVDVIFDQAKPTAQ
jgi:hypothetical protein